MADAEIDTSDSPPLGEDFFAAATLRAPAGRVPVVLSVDAEVMEWFKSQGDDYADLMDAALRLYAEAHKAARR